jgi:hypothetical protein
MFRRADLTAPPKRHGQKRDVRLPNPEVLASSGVPLDVRTRDFLEPRLGHDLRDIRIVSDTHADEASRDLNARAFATGDRIFFRSGEFNPGSADGMRLLVHEATHAIQQRQGHVALPPGGELLVGDVSDPLETAADRAADEVMRGGPAITPGVVPLAGTSAAATGLIQRQVANPDLDPSSYEPGEERIVTDRPRRDGQVNRTQFLRLLEERLPAVIIETVAADRELSADMPDVQSIVEHALQWSLAEYADAESLDDCLRARFHSEFDRFVVHRLGNGSSTEFISTADKLVGAIEHQLRENLKRDIDDMRAEEPTQEQWEARIASAADGAAAEKAQGERDHETMANQERHSGLLPGLIEHSVVSLWIDGGTKVKPTRRQMQALLKRGS